MTEHPMGEMMRAVTKAARSVSIPVVSFRPECRMCPPYVDKIAVDSIITSIEGSGVNRSIKVKRERDHG